MKAPKLSIEKRILNELGSRVLNEERLDEVVGLRKDISSQDHKTMVFRCECDDSGCDEIISMSVEEYQRMHHSTKCFIVTPAHVRLDIEEIMSSFDTYILVSKRQAMLA